MKTEWNDALAAYDRECSIVEGVRKQYFDFLNKTLRDVARSVETSISFPTDSRNKLDVTEVDATWSDGLIDVVVWPSSPHGGPAGLFRVALYLQRGPLERADVPSSAVLAAAAGPEVIALPGEAFETDAHPDAEEDARLALRIATVSADDAQLRSKLASLVTTYAGARDHVTRAMLGPYGWMQLCLRGLVAAPLGEVGRGKWASKPLEDPWAGGRYVQWQSEREDDYAWVATQPPDGRLVFGFSGRFEQDAAFHAALCACLNSRPEFMDNCPCGVLLDAPAVREAFENGERARIVAVARGALHAYFVLADQHAGNS